MALATAPSGVRACALRDCDNLVPESGIGRRYCCSEHRNAARAARGIRTSADSQRERAIIAASYRTSPAPPTPRPIPTATELAASARRRHRNRTVREILALAGGFIVVVVLTNAMLVTSQAPGRGLEAEPPMPEAMSARQWADQAQAALATVDQQLTLITEAITAWDRQPPRLRKDTPTEVSQLRARGDALRQRQAHLVSQLRDYDELGHKIESIRRTLRMLNDLGQAPATSSDRIDVGDDAQQQRLNAARERLAHDLAAQRRERAALETGVREAMRTTPVLGQQFVAQTTALINTVHDYISHPERRGHNDPAPAMEAAPPRPKATSPRRSQQAPRQQATTGAPPNPGKLHSDKPASQRPASVPPSAPAAPRTAQVKAGDTLWGMATTYLGDATRWPEIYYLNRARIQPDGERMTSPKLIRPGWTLLLPERRR